MTRPLSDLRSAERMFAPRRYRLRRWVPCVLQVLLGLAIGLLFGFLFVLFTGLLEDRLHHTAWWLSPEAREEAR